MPAQRNNVVQSLSIALIVFVMLTFVLAVTTYVFFKQQIDEQVKVVEAQAAATKVKGELDSAVAEKKVLLRVIGYPEDDEKAASDVETEITDIFKEKFAAEPEESRNWRRVAELLQSSIAAKDKDLKALEDDKKKLAVDTEAAQKKLAESEANAAEEKAKFGQDLAANKTDFDNRLEEHKKNLAAASNAQESSLKRSTSLDSLTTEIAKGEAYLSAAGKKKFEASTVAEERVKLLFAELREREKTISNQNSMLADLGAADKNLQETILAASSKTVEGFDGKIASVDEGDRTVLIDFRTTRGLQPGLLFYVYDPADPKPEVSAKKGIVEVVAVESGSLARARVRQDGIRNPILSGDAVATSLWTPGTAFEAVIVGFVQLDADAKPDTDRLQELLERVGGHVERAVSPSTSMVVDAGLPRKLGVADDQAAGWKPIDDTRRNNQLKEARRLGIRVVGIEAFLEMLGLDRGSLTSDRLPRLDGKRSPPGRGNDSF